MVSSCFASNFATDEDKRFTDQNLGLPCIGDQCHQLPPVQSPPMLSHNGYRYKATDSLPGLPTGMPVVKPTLGSAKSDAQDILPSKIDDSNIGRIANAENPILLDPEKLDWGRSRFTSILLANLYSNLSMTDIQKAHDALEPRGTVEIFAPATASKDSSWSTARIVPVLLALGFSPVYLHKFEIEGPTKRHHSTRAGHDSEVHLIIAQKLPEGSDVARSQEATYCACNHGRPVSVYGCRSRGLVGQWPRSQPNVSDDRTPGCGVTRGCFMGPGHQPDPCSVCSGRAHITSGETRLVECGPPMNGLTFQLSILVRGIGMRTRSTMRNEGDAAFERHQKKEGNHEPQIIPIPTRPGKQPLACQHGCDGQEFPSAKLRNKHHQKAHYKCGDCNGIFDGYSKLQHQHYFGHMTFAQLARSPQDPVIVTEFDKYAEKILELVRECLGTEGDHPRESRWHGVLAMLRQLVPENHPPQTAHIASSENLDPAAHAWRLTTDKLDQLLDEEAPLNDRLILKGTRPTRNEDAIHQELCANLLQAFKGMGLSVQDMTSTTGMPAKMPTETVVSRIEKGADIQGGTLPINLLDMMWAGQAPPAPEFLNRRRFAVTALVDARAKVERAKTDLVGKTLTRTSARGQKGNKEENPSSALLDLWGYIYFMLFSQKGSFTGFHCDNPGGTFLRILTGLKVIFVPARWDEQERQNFAEYGDQWVPSQVRIIVLQPGDTFVMMPGGIVPHAVLTLEDSLVCGGMFLDARRILDTLESQLWMVENPRVTNEPAPLQLIVQGGLLRDYVKTEDQERFDSLWREVQSRLSCDCRTCKTCYCKLARDGMCNDVCRKRKMAKSAERAKKPKADGLGKRSAAASEDGLAWSGPTISDCARKTGRIGPRWVWISVLIIIAETPVPER
ncbi:uncharacterized protein VDAG_04855 [Verticillium dahliae VdLs.17]|uniref:JmjC domain-containing protein n=1 Tax=Verticillium dahliae (strain VdLs.17 / ATCC MYA-4575 / FGSC 10137) TaxID=498257 RepID=G2X370_VERDV|nr:uncharacterized protein VDAG_04855 [Verticillium dahliae VdLs.17]EGY23417.1 hypothetical protein VDAG_04855 [Verticillium dahliae VdLs.17]